MERKKNNRKVGWILKGDVAQIAQLGYFEWKFRENKQLPEQFIF